MKKTKKNTEITDADVQAAKAIIMDRGTSVKTIMDEEKRNWYWVLEHYRHPQCDLSYGEDNNTLVAMHVGGKPVMVKLSRRVGPGFIVKLDLEATIIFTTEGDGTGSLMNTHVTMCYNVTPDQFMMDFWTELVMLMMSKDGVRRDLARIAMKEMFKSP